MKLSFTPHFLFFKHPFKIAHGIRTSTPIVITELEHDGVIGYGEASMPPYLGESHDSAAGFLMQAAEVLRKFSDPFATSDILQAMDAIASGHPAAKASIDIALHDLQGKLWNKPVWEMIGLEAKGIFSTYTIGMDEPEVINAKINEAAVFPVLKIKLGSSEDKKIIESVRACTQKPIAVDVNQGWKDKYYALDMIQWLKEKNVLFVEQPLPKDQWKEMAWLREKSPLITIGDESVQRLVDIEKAKDTFHGINVKLMKSTGIYEGKKMMEEAKKSGMKVLIGCMSETSCGISAAAQLSPLADWADLDGAHLIKNDLFAGIPIVDGKILLGKQKGIGVTRKA
jgi:L-Ala-D/L-Glu epimerase